MSREYCFNIENRTFQVCISYASNLYDRQMKLEFCIIGRIYCSGMLAQLADGPGISNLRPMYKIGILFWTILSLA